MKQERVERYKQQLRHADNEWRNAGLIPDTQNGTSEGYAMMRYLDAYRGDFPDVVNGGVESEDQMAANLAFSIVNTMVSTISGATPDPVLTPMGGRAAGQGSKRSAWINEQVVRTIAIERKFKREVDMMLLSAVLTPFGIVRHGWTPDIEYEDDNGKIIPRFKNQTPDLPWIQFVRPWDVRIDPMVSSLHPDSEPRWVAFRNLWFDYQIEDNDNLIFRKDLKPTHFSDLRPHEERKGRPLQEGGPDTMPMFEEWVVYDFERQSFFGISPGSDQLIREEKEWPFNWGRLPYSFLGFNPQIDSPFPVPYMRMFYEEQLMVNRVWTIIKAMIVRTQRIIFYDKNRLDDEEANLTNPEFIKEFIGVDGNPNEAAREFSSGQFDGQLLGLVFKLEEQIREVLGVSRFDRGQRANVETASEANQIGAGSARSHSRNQTKVEEVWEDIYRVSHRTFLQSEDAREMVIPIIGQENLQFLDQQDRENGFFATSVGDLQGEFQYSVRLGTTIKQDPGQQLAVKTAVFNTLGGVNSKMLQQRHWHDVMVDLSGEDPRQAIIDEKTAALMAQQDAQADDGEGGGGNDSDASVRAAGQQGLPDVINIAGGS